MRLFVIKLFVILALTWNFGESVRQVVLTCGNDDGTEDGFPGPRGPPGKLGPTGPQGPKGDPGQNDTWVEAFQRLNQTIVELQNRFRHLQGIQHFVLPSNQITWPRSVAYCEGLGLLLCSYAEIFPYNNNVPFLIGVQNGDYWTPIRDSNNQWVQIGNNPHRTGLLHTELGSKPPWGLRVTDHPFKRHIYCCM